MLNERRKSLRQHFSRFARFQADVAGPSRDCLIINISNDGVRLHSEFADMPPEFTLVIADADRPRRSCRVIWRLGFEVGAEFTDGRPPVARIPAA